MKALIFCAVVRSFSSSLQAQDLPGLSGQWALVQQPNSSLEVPLTLTVTEETQRSADGRIARNVITIVRRYETGSRSDTYELGILGGRVGGLPARDPDAIFTVQQTHRIAVLRGGALVIDEGFHDGPVPEKGQWLERQETWTLVGSAELQVTIDIRSRDSERQNIVLKYHRNNSAR